MKTTIIIATIVAISTVGCNTATSKKINNPQPTISVEFNADSAYKYIDDQVNFGPRVPNSESHAQCAEYLVNTLTRHGAEVQIQEGEASNFENKILPIKNIIAQYSPDKANRILLCAHWDCRPFADYDPNPARRNTPIDGANDGASGVGVLLEIARQLNIKKPNVGIDIILFDVEDYGTPDHIVVDDYKQDTWCLGSQFWARSEKGQSSTARYGILLDMVGAPGAQFYQEMFSKQTAQNIVDKVWRAAATIGHNNYFVMDDGGYITDDHYYVNRIAGIPCIDIIQYDPSSATSFGSYWHTHNDTMDNIDKSTLTAVGETVLYVLYNER